MREFHIRKELVLALVLTGVAFGMLWFARNHNLQVAAGFTRSPTLAFTVTAQILPTLTTAPTSTRLLTRTPTLTPLPPPTPTEYVPSDEVLKAHTDRIVKLNQQAGQNSHLFFQLAGITGSFTVIQEGITMSEGSYLSGAELEGDFDVADPACAALQTGQVIVRGDTIFRGPDKILVGNARFKGGALVQGDCQPLQSEKIR